MNTTSKQRDWTYPWETFGGWLCMVGYLIAVIAGIWIPDDVQTQAPAVRAFTETMAAWNPQVAFVGNMPFAAAKASQVMYAVLWCVMPICWAMVISTSYRRLKPANFVFTFKSWGELLALLFGLSLLVYILLQPQGDLNSRFGQLLFGQKLMRALIAPWMVFVTGLLSISILCFLATWLTGRIRYGAGAKRRLD